MNSSIQQTGNQVVVTVTGGKNDLEPTLRTVYNNLRQSVEASGFRKGKVPNEIIDKQLGVEKVQAEVIDAAAEKLYRQAINEHQLRPITNPQITVKKFVPYSELELDIKVEVMPEVKLPDYTKINKQAENTSISKQEVDEVLESLRQRLAQRQSVERPAKNGDEVTIDFSGSQDGKPVPGAQASDYSLVLGSNQFIPGFEEQLIGQKAGDKKEFTITFPKDYGEKSLAGSKVDFTVNVKKVAEITTSELNDDFAKNAGPFESLAGLRRDVTSHLESEKEQAALRKLENEVVAEVVEKTKVDLPEAMVENERNRVVADVKRRLTEQGLELEAYLEQTGQSQKDHEAEIEKQARNRVKTALVLTEVAKKENLEVKPDELEVRLQLIAGKYQDRQIQQELTKPQVRQEINDQLLAEKTVKFLVDKATGK